MAPEWSLSPPTPPPPSLGWDWQCVRGRIHSPALSADKGPWGRGNRQLDLRWKIFATGGISGRCTEWQAGKRAGGIQQCHQALDHDSFVTDPRASFAAGTAFSVRISQLFTLERGQGIHSWQPGLFSRPRIALPTN